MTKVKNLQMWHTICTDARISINKSLFGLSITAIYIRTNSPLSAYIFEYSHDDGEELKSILESPREKLYKMVVGFHPKKTVNGNFKVEVCASHDGQFIAVLISQFVQMSYEPVSDVLIFEGQEAQAVKQLF